MFTVKKYLTMWLILLNLDMSLDLFRIKKESDFSEMNCPTSKGVHPSAVSGRVRNHRRGGVRTRAESHYRAIFTERSERKNGWKIETSPAPRSFARLSKYAIIIREPYSQEIFCPQPQISFRKTQILRKLKCSSLKWACGKCKLVLLKRRRRLKPSLQLCEGSSFSSPPSNEFKATTRSKRERSNVNMMLAKFWLFIPPPSLSVTLTKPLLTTVSFWATPSADFVCKGPQRREDWWWFKRGAICKMGEEEWGNNLPSQWDNQITRDTFRALFLLADAPNHISGSVTGCNCHDEQKQDICYFLKREYLNVCLCDAIL